MGTLVLQVWSAIRAFAGAPPPITISTCALLFTVASFWWMNWRKGRLHVGPPRSFAAAGTKDKLIVKVPIVFFNDGAIPIIVQNMRLLLGEIANPTVMHFVATADDLAGATNRQMAAQFPIGARQAVRVYCEFQKQDAFCFLAQEYPFKLQVKTGESDRWRTALRSSLRVPRYNKWKPPGL